MCDGNGKRCKRLEVFILNDIVEVTPELIEKYDLQVPRYTSYPTVPNWSKKLGYSEYLAMLKETFYKNDSLSIYIHIPFCSRRCLFCACNVLVTQRKDRVDKYLHYLKKEMRFVSSLFEKRKKVVQVHLGGGTPTHLTPTQLETLFTEVWDAFEIQKGSELSIEVHPSVTTYHHVDILRDFGFNRLSMGVQDFDPIVQKHLNRYQTFEETQDLVNYARNVGMESINIDLIYGLPYQTSQGFHDTLIKIEEIRPDRLAMYSYAHFPNIFRHHKFIPLTKIPQGRNKLQLFLDARRYLLDIGYKQIGFDHFSLKSDGLWKSYRNKTLRRNFMGFTTKKGTDLIAFGYSGISELENGYAQNTKEMGQYENFIEKVGVATIKGHRMSNADRFRKKLIMDFLCLGEINASILENHYEFLAILETKSKTLAHFETIGFLKKKAYGWEATTLGTIFSRVIASIFDAYYDTNMYQFSKSI